jgi:hypothetical protein
MGAAAVVLVGLLTGARFTALAFADGPLLARWNGKQLTRTDARKSPTLAGITPRLIPSYSLRR